MYREYFGLKELPFSLAPDPRYLYMSEQHREALAHLMYGINSEGGFVLLTGEVGTGKTTVCRCLLEQVPEDCNIAFILNPKLTAEELLATICDELVIKYPEGNTSIKVFVDLINTYLLDAHAKGRKTVLIIEEAQNLSTDVLEQVRLLTNLETSERKLLQVIMVGQPELKNKLSKPELLQLAQRITARYHLGPLSKGEVAAYVNHRLAVAGAHSKLFSDSVFGKLYHLSAGVPRMINILCDRALLGAHVRGKNRVGRHILSRAAREVFGKMKARGKPKRTLRWALAGLLVIVCVAALTAIYFDFVPNPLDLFARSPLQQKTIPAPVVEPPQLSPLEWPADQPIHRSKEIASQSLLRQWGIEYNPEGGSLCAQAQGLSCFEERESLGNILKLNRPVMLKLLDTQGREFYATVTAIKGQTATFFVGTETRVVDVKELEKKWLGDYTLLWRMPPGYKSPLVPGQKGKMVRWLERQLSLIQGREARSAKSLVYDENLVKQVKKFQLSKGLVPDGIVGPHTIIHLNTVAGSKEPLLVGKGDK